jgi:repressor LexA
MTLTKRQKEVLDFVSFYTDEYGYAPTIKEICSRFSLSSVATVHKHLTRLEEKGYIERTPNASRSLSLVDREGAHKSVELPLLGFIAAGKPIDSVEQPESLSVPEDMLGRGKTFVLRVKGNSMIDEQIKDGDYVIVKERNHAENGETVVALLNGEEVTLKKYYREDSRIRLQPANPEVEPIYVEEEEVTVQGVVIGIMRKYS